MESNHEATLVRALGVREVAANVINNVLGAGIFALPGVVAAILGVFAPVAYLVCAVAIGLIALCLAEDGSRVQTSGGPYAYVEAAFGPFVGFLAGVLYWFGELATASAALAIVFVESLGALVPAISGPVWRGVLLVVLYFLLAVVNVRGVRAGARLIEIVTAGKLIPLVLLIVGGAFLIEPRNLAWTAVPKFADIGRASLVLIFAFIGIEGALTASGEIRTPARTVPRAIFIGLGAVTVVYLGLQVISQGVLGPTLATETTAPLAAVAQRLAGHLGAVLILATTALSVFGFVSSDLLGSPRLLYAFAAVGTAPAPLGRIHSRFRTPHVAIVAHASICCALALSGSFQVLAVLTTVATLLVYLGCCLAVLELRRRDVRTEVAPFRIAGGPVVPLLACVVVLWMLKSAGPREYLATGGILVAASALYLARRR